MNTQVQLNIIYESPSGGASKRTKITTMDVYKAMTPQGPVAGGDLNSLKPLKPEAKGKGTGVGSA